MISAVITDNLTAQAARLAMFRATNREHVAIVHVYCSTLVPNLIISGRRDAGSLSHRVDRLFPFHVILRKRAARVFLGKVYPLLIPTSRLYMVDVLDVLLSNRRQINSSLLTQDVLDPFIPLSISKKKLFSNSMLLPYHFVLAAFESGDRTISEIVPLFREVQANLRKVSNVRDTVISKQILHINVARFYARLLTNRHQEVITADLFALLGREELRTEHKGYQTIRTEN